MLATNFIMRMAPKERKMLSQIAKRFERSQADAIRVLIRQQHALIVNEKTGKAAEGEGLSKVHERA